MAVLPPDDSEDTNLAFRHKCVTACLIVLAASTVVYLILVTVSLFVRGLASFGGVVASACALLLAALGEGENRWIGILWSILFGLICFFVLIGSAAV